MFSFSLLKDIRFVSFCFCILLYNASTKNVLTFLPAMAKENGVGDVEAALLLSIFGATDFVGRVSSSIMDAKALKPYRPYIYIVLPALLGVVSFLFTIVHTMMGYGILIAFLGLFVGLFVSQKSVFIVDLLGPGKLMDAFGLVCMFQGFGILAGPPIAGNNTLSLDIDIDKCIYYTDCVNVIHSYYFNTNHTFTINDIY